MKGTFFGVDFWNAENCTVLQAGDREQPVSAQPTRLSFVLHTDSTL